MKPHISRSGGAIYLPGLRPFLEYRSLGLDEATTGNFGAKLIRGKGNTSDYRGTGKHAHQVKLQFVLVLRGWVDFEFNSGRYRLSEGDFLVIPPNEPHEQVGYSPDVQLLEVTSPADFVTADVHADDGSFSTKGGADGHF